MARHRKLGRPAAERKALLRNQVTNLIYHGKIKTTDTKAKEIRKMAERIIASAVREHANFDEVTVMSKNPKKDADGRRIKEEKNGKRVNVYEEVEKTIKKDHSSKLHARRQMLKFLYPVTEVSPNKKRQAKRVDLTEMLFEEIAPKYVDRNGGYTRTIKIGPRKGDAAEMVIIELV